jgi:hypothetical protein
VRPGVRPNPYFGTACSTSTSGEPDVNGMQMKVISPRLFKRKAITLKFAGAGNEDGIAYRWSTVFKLKRVK